MCGVSEGGGEGGGIGKEGKENEKRWAGRIHVVACK